VTGEILGIHDAHRSAIGINRDEIIDSVGLKDMQHLGGEFVGGNGDGIRSHEFGDGPRADIGCALKMSGKVPMCKDACQASIGFHDDCGASAALSHEPDRMEYGSFPRYRGELVRGAHDLAHPEEEGAAKMTAGMESREVVLVEAARFQENHRQRIPEGKHGGGAGGRRQIERTRFLRDAHIEYQMRCSSERRLCISRDGYDLDVESGKGGEQVVQLLGLTAIAQGQDRVAVGDNAEIAMERVEGIQHHGRAAGAREGGRNLFPNVPGLSDPDDDDLPIPLDAGAQEIDRSDKIFIESRRDGLHGRDLDVEYAAGLTEIIHEGEIVSR